MKFAARLMQKLRMGWIFFWQGKEREPEAEESLAALLARREQVRTTQTAPAQPQAELFRPQKPVTLPLDEDTPLSADAPKEEPKPAPESESGTKPPPTTTTSRLLDAKRRAQKRKE